MASVFVAYFLNVAFESPLVNLERVLLSGGGGGGDGCKADEKQPPLANPPESAKPAGAGPAEAGKRMPLEWPPAQQLRLAPPAPHFGTLTRACATRRPRGQLPAPALVARARPSKYSTLQSGWRPAAAGSGPVALSSLWLDAPATQAAQQIYGRLIPRVDCATLGRRRAELGLGGLVS